LGQLIEGEDAQVADAGEERKGGRRGRRPRRPKPRAGRKRPNGDRRASLISAIDHPLRRRILRQIRDCGEARSPVQLAQELGASLGTVSYHVKVLSGFDALRKTGEQQARGAVEHFYESTIENEPSIEALLEETREADDKA
jgi:DNA-binding transcriptional ArsR family regulator